MYRVSIVNNKYRAVLVASNASANTIFEDSDWRVFAAKLKEAMEHEAQISLHADTVKIRRPSALEVSEHGERRRSNKTV
jgi:hypothetical protein